MHADFIVIGGGIAGASVAYELSRTASVLVLEGESQPGYHSTGRSAALFSEIYGNAAVRALSRASREFLSTPPPAFATNALLKPRGSLFVASADQIEAFELLQDAPDVAQHTRPLTAAEAQQLVPIIRDEWLALTMLEEGSQDVDVHALHQGYLRGMKERRASVVSAALVQSIVRRENKWHVTAAGQQFEAPVVINAAGAWADEIAKLAGVRPVGLEPRRRTALLIDAPAGTSIDRWPMVLDVGDTFYFKPDAGRLLLSPADETPSPPCDVQPDDLDVAIAVDRFEQATTVSVERVRHQWAGLRSFVSDRSPVIGFDSQVEGFFWLAGQGGYGIQTAPAAGRLATALLTHQEPAPEVASFVPGLSPGRLQR
ncbi:MAG TPA: FAD-binding oxidoreductase [Steroidobacteraceae bacterium]|nr:FAD-binding oxidoreductase [Steroidobacteraceae bacterium]